MTADAASGRAASDASAASDATARRPRTPFDAPLAAWFRARGWTPQAFQRQVWRHWLRGDSGLLVSPTGSGKTLAVFGGPLLEGLREQRKAASASPPKRAPRRGHAEAAGQVRLLWITPLRALATDTTRALREAIDAVGLPWIVAMRTGDASARDRRLARQGRADVIVITPESLSLLLTYPETGALLGNLTGVIVDEWHELLGSKRGVLLQLALARLRAFAPTLRTWGLSATLGNLEEARDVLLPHAPHSPIVRVARRRPVDLVTLLPEHPERFPWAGHLGMAQLGAVLRTVEATGTSLLFTNTRSQAELWHRALSSVWLGELRQIALHHGSLDPKLRAEAEAGLRDGSIRCVVATSSLDLGVDFPAVDQVLQLGSPKGLARLTQRAGRARHRPGESGRIVCIPTHALELAEYAAARTALAAGDIESRPPPRLSLDVLAQHCVTLALGGGFQADALLAEVRGTHAFADLTGVMWQAVLDFIVQGGAALAHYPDYHRAVRDDDGAYRVTDRKVAFRHRLSIGTITSDGALQVRFLKGGYLGTLEESFLARLRPRERFQFAGRTLELVQLKDMTAYVKLATSGEGTVPRWQGSRMPMSSELGRQVEATLGGERDSAEMQALSPLLDTQARLSGLPSRGQLLAELVHARDGSSLFVYPFAGRMVHEGLAALLALRWGRRAPNTFGLAVNDYGLALRGQARAPLDAGALAAMFSDERLLEDLRESLNLAELARRQFREIARVAGLLPPSLPGKAARSLRQLQASSGLMFDVLQRFDPDHILLAQAEREVFESQLEVRALRETLARCRERRLQLCVPRSLTPLSFPLWAEMQRGQLSTEDWKTRIERAAARLGARDERSA